MSDNFRLPRRLSALLIDGDNISPARAEEIYALLHKIGLPEVRRVYGNIALTKGWATRPGFRTIHSGEGKNATDLLLSIEAMDLLHQGRLARVILVSSDGDYTHLVHRLREEGVEVIGMGEAKTPQTMREACSSFVTLEAPRPADPMKCDAPPTPKNAAGAAIPAKPAASAPVHRPAQPSAPTQPLPPKSASGGTAALQPSQRSKGRAAEVLELVQKLIAQSQNPRGLALSKLGISLHQQLGVTLKGLGATSWHGWLSARPQIFLCEPRGPDCHIRLAKTPAQRRAETV